MSKKCPKGMIERVGFIRKSSSGKKRIPSKCIKKQGRPGVKGPKLIEMKELGLLRHFNYAIHSSDTSRHVALDKAVKKYGELKVLHRVNALRTFQKSHPDLWKRFDNDVKYLENKYFPDRHGAEKSVAKPYTKKERSKPRTKREVQKAESAAKRRKSSNRKRKTKSSGRRRKTKSRSKRKSKSKTKSSGRRRKTKSKMKSKRKSKSKTKSSGRRRKTKSKSKMKSKTKSKSKRRRGI